MTVGHLLHDLHGQLVLVAGVVGNGKDRRQFMLGGRHLVVLGAGIDAQFPQLLVQFFHEGLDPGLDDAEIVIIQLLPFGSRCAEKRSAANAQIFPLCIGLFVHKEILLLCAHTGMNPGHILVAQQIHHSGCLH